MKRQFHKQIILLFFLLLSNTIIGYSLQCCDHYENEPSQDKNFDTLTDDYIFRNNSKTLVSFIVGDLSRFSRELSPHGRDRHLTYLIKLHTDEIDCCYVDRLRTTMVEFINGENKNVYEDDFLFTLKKNKTAAGNCYFPGANDIAMFWSFIENTLVKESENDKRAISLLIDLNIAYKNNAELSGELFTQAINKVALQCLECFISELSLRSNQEIDFTILKLDYLKDDEAKIILDQLNALRKPEYQYIVGRIKNILRN